MKISKYNIFVPYQEEKNKYIAYNSLNSSLALMNESDFEKYKKFESGGIDIVDKDLVDQLKEGGFIIEDGVDEKKQIRFNMYKEKFATDSLSLTIAPTSDCNFRCIYCYEKDSIKQNYMSIETQEKLIQLVKAYSKRISHLSLAWYGGEPLLAMDIIENLSNEFISICDKNNISYYASMITNGYNLTRENIEKLNKCRVELIQITIDGDGETHNKRRFLKGGQPTFNRIFHNLIDNKDILPGTVIRINVDNGNYNEIENIVDLLVKNNLQEKVKPYLGHVTNTNDCYSENNCLNFYDFCDLHYNFEDYLYSKGFTESRTDKYPQRIGTVCCADTFNSHVIDANGDLYRCWSDIGNISRKIGNINDGDNIKTNSQYIEFLMYDPTSDEKCEDCKHLPICMGGCPAKVRDNIEDRCSNTKIKLEEYLNNVINEMKQLK